MNALFAGEHRFQLLTTECFVVIYSKCYHGFVALRRRTKRKRKISCALKRRKSSQRRMLEKSITVPARILTATAFSTSTTQPSYNSASLKLQVKPFRVPSNQIKESNDLIDVTLASMETQWAYFMSQFSNNKGSRAAGVLPPMHVVLLLKATQLW